MVHKVSNSVKWLIALLLIAVSAAAQNPPLENLREYGYSVKHVEGEYRLTGWAWHNDPDLRKQDECGRGKDWCIELYRSSSLDRTVKAGLKWYHKVEKAVTPKAEKH